MVIFCLCCVKNLGCFRLNRSLVWEYLRGIWADERCTESSLWLIHSKMDVPSITSIKKHLEGKSHNMQLLSKPVAQKPIEEVSSLGRDLPLGS